MTCEVISLDSFDESGFNLLKSQKCVLRATNLAMHLSKFRVSLKSRMHGMCQQWPEPKRMTNLQKHMLLAITLREFDCLMRYPCFRSLEMHKELDLVKR
jgi:hypothetical protein